MHRTLPTVPTVFILSLILIFQSSNALHAENSEGRFTMTQTDDGFLRLDTKTGAVALCGRADQTWSCKPVRDDQLPTQQKLATLEQENSELKTEIEDLRRVLDGQLAKGTPSNGTGPSLKFPTDSDIDKVMTTLEKLARRFKGLVQELKDAKVPGTPL